MQAPENAIVLQADSSQGKVAECALICAQHPKCNFFSIFSNFGNAYCTGCKVVPSIDFDVSGETSTSLWLARGNIFFNYIRPVDLHNPCAQTRA